ncbi:MAG: C_GCAxxG_C_C family protein [Candidatus Krumholzibacteriota bacterium]|nr:C_GCAxxG_C_C family protein [Candidatus Krumholzibacteriota bacterium]
MNKPESAAACFEEGFSCAQAIVSAFGEESGLDREMALKVSGAFGGGMGRMGETCGVVTGAVIVIGLKYAKTKAEDDGTKEKAYSLVREFVEKFKSQNGSTLCRELLGCDISTPEGMKYSEENKISANLCPKLVRYGAELLEQILG